MFPAKCQSHIRYSHGWEIPVKPFPFKSSYYDHLPCTFRHIFLQLCTGGDLFTYITTHTETESRLCEGEAKYIMYQLLKGLEYLHEKAISHRGTYLPSKFSRGILITNHYAFGLDLKVIALFLSVFCVNDLNHIFINPIAREHSPVRSRTLPSHPNCRLWSRAPESLPRNSQRLWNGIVSSPGRNSSFG